MRHNLYLALRFARRELMERYVGTTFGQLWYLLSPLVLIFIYTVIFSDFMKMKLDLVQSRYAYSIYLVPGLLAWNSFNALLLLMSSSILDKAHLIRKVNVPIYVFQISTLLSEGVVFLISMALGVGFLLLIGHPVGWSMLWLLPVMGLQLLFTFSLGVFLSLLLPFFEDLREALPIVLQLFFWMTPIVYVPALIAGKYPWLLHWNPIYHYLEVYQNLFLYGRPPDFSQLLELTLLPLLLLLIAAWFYRKTVPAVKDIL